MLAGFLFVAGASASDGSDLRAERRTDLTDLVRAREADIAERTARLNDLSDEVGSMTSAGMPSSAASSSSEMHRPVMPLPVMPTHTAWVVRSFES